MVRPASLARDLLVCAATAGLLLVGPILDAALHPASPLWLPYASLPDASVYVAMFRRASEGTLGGDPFVWEHRGDPSSILSIFAFWPRVFGTLLRLAGDRALPLAGLALSTLWFFGLFRLCRALGQVPRRAFVAAGLACFFAVNLAYNLNGYKLHFGAWSFALSEHLRVYPTVASMAVYALAAWRLFAALTAPSAWRAALAGLLVAATALGRPFDWMVLETAAALLALALLGSGRKRAGWAAVAVTTTGGLLAAPVITRLALHQARHAEAFNDLMWRGIYHAKSLAHYGKYTFAVLAVGALLAFAYRRALGGRPFREWPLSAIFPLAMVLASLLPYYHTLPRQVTVTGFSYFFVFSFSTWSVVALFQVLEFRRPPPVGRPCRVEAAMPWVLLAAILAQQLSLGLGQRGRQASNVIPPELREVYRRIREDAPEGAVILSERPGTEVVTETRRWLLSPTPVVATLLSPTPTAELLERGLWAEFLLGADLDALAPIFAEGGMPGYAKWKDTLSEEARASVQRLETRVGYNTFVFHALLNRWDLRARGLALPARLEGRDEYVAWFRPELRPVFARVREASRSGTPPPFRLDLAILGPGRPVDSSRLAGLGFRASRFPGGIEVWSRQGGELRLP